MFTCLKSRLSASDLMTISQGKLRISGANYASLVNIEEVPTVESFRTICSGPTPLSLLRHFAAAAEEEKEEGNRLIDSL